MNHSKSEAWFQQACTCMPGGVNSPVRSFANAQMSALFVDHASGSHVYDVDGNDFLDYIGSWGPMILGHSCELLEQSLQVAINKGISYGLCTPDEVRLAQLICEAYQGVEMVRMVNSGTEATMSAIRLARGYTKRDKIIKFEGCYHGHSDGLLVKAGSGALTFATPTSPGIPFDVTKHTLVATYNDITSVDALLARDSDRIAAVILEPVAGNMGVVPATKEFLCALRSRCDTYGIVLIFDEVISGFRLSYGGAAQLYGIVPDLVCFGKIIGAGLPVGAYGGRKTIMSCVSPIGPVYQAGTLSGNPLAMHLGCTLLSYLKEHPQVYDELASKGAYLRTGIETILKEQGLPYTVSQIGSLLTIFFSAKTIRNYDDVCTCDQSQFVSFFQRLYAQGILIAPSPFEAMFISMAHTQEELDATLSAMRIAFAGG